MTRCAWPSGLPALLSPISRTTARELIGKLASRKGSETRDTHAAKLHGKEKTHFDTNHLATVIWDESILNDAEDKLAAMIRITLPDEAVLDD